MKNFEWLFICYKGEAYIMMSKDCQTVCIYRKDRNYTIDNILAEWCIKLLANERKNSLFFGSGRMARISATYHSVVFTCRFQRYSILEYLKRFFVEITISITANKL